jgi:hypothetical protein
MTRRRNTLIFRTVVDTNDSAAVGQLLQLVPDSAKLEPLIRSRFAETRYDPQTRREFWIGGNARHIICLMITGIGIDEVSRIRSLFGAGRESINLADVVSHAADVTGGAVHLMN